MPNAGQGQCRMMQCHVKPESILCRLTCSTKFSQPHSYSKAVRSTSKSFVIVIEHCLAWLWLYLYLTSRQLNCFHHLLLNQLFKTKSHIHIALSAVTMTERERSFIMLKPDGVQRGLVGEVVKRFEQKGFKVVAMKFTWASESLLKEHYADLAARAFFPGLVSYMSSGPVVPMVWEGLNVVKTGRQMLGETDPAKSLPGTIRGDYCIEVGRNIIHGSDSVESAKKEVNLWFKPEEVVEWKSNGDPWLYE